MGLGAAVAIGGVAAAGASLAGASMQASASKKAAQEQAQSSANALAQQQSMFGTAQTALNPYISAGDSTLSTLTSLENPGTAASTLSSLPGLQFQQQYGTLSTQNTLAAEGLGGSGGPLGTALSQYNQGLASTYYNNYVSQLQNTANMGSNAASALAGYAVNAGNSQAQTIQNQGTATASGTLGSANALSSGLTSASSSLTNGLVLSSLLGQNSGVYGSSAASSPFQTAT
jgi:hypothetical protein